MSGNHNPRRQAIARLIPDWRTVARGSWVIALAFILGGILLVRASFGALPDGWLGLVLALGLPWVILSGILVVIHKEEPGKGMSSITGAWAVIHGVFGILVFGGLEIWVLYLLIKGLVTK